MRDIIISCPPEIAHEASEILNLSASLEISHEEANDMLMDLISPFCDRVPRRGDHLIFRPDKKVQSQVPRGAPI